MADDTTSFDTKEKVDVLIKSAFGFPSLDESKQWFEEVSAPYNNYIIGSELFLDEIPKIPDFDTNGTVKSATDIGLETTDFKSYSVELSNKSACSIVDDSTGTIRRIRLLVLDVVPGLSTSGCSWYKLNSSSENIIKNALQFNYNKYKDGNTPIQPYSYTLNSELNTNLSDPILMGKAGGNWFIDIKSGILFFPDFSNFAKSNIDIAENSRLDVTTNKPVLTIYTYIGRIGSSKMLTVGADEANVTSPENSQIFVNTTDNTIHRYDIGTTAWVPIGGSGGSGGDLIQTKVDGVIVPEWYQLGVDIYGETAFDNSGYSVSLSHDGTIVAIGAPGNDGVNGTDSGHVRVYQYTNSNWTQLGNDIDGKVSEDEFGSSVSLSSDGSILAIGAHGSDEGGQVGVYQYNNSNTTWDQLGSDINGELDLIGSCEVVSLSSDGTILAIGSTSNAGYVRIYKYNDISTNWDQLGSNITDGGGGKFGYSLSLSKSNNVTTIAVGSPYNDGTGNYDVYGRGRVRVYQYNDTTTTNWDQLGGDIYGESTNDNSGISVSLSGDGSILAIGSPNSAADTGSVRVYQLDGNKTTANSDPTDASFGPIGWTRLGGDIDGEATDFFGNSVSLSSDGSILAIGAKKNEGNENNAGRVRVYRRDSSARIGWTIVEPNLNGERDDDLFGWQVSLSGDGTSIAIGATRHYGNNGENSGHVKVYHRDSTIVDRYGVDISSNLYVKGSIQVGQLTIANEPIDRWTQLGEDITGESVDSNMGAVCALSNDGSTLASMSNTNYTARYFFIQLDTENEYLVESEIEIYDENGTNIALNKTPVIQSSYHKISTYPASKGNDGITNYSNLWTSPVPGERGWWAVDLGSDQKIASIKVFGFYTTSYIPGGATYSRTAPFRIFLYEDADYPNSSFIDGGTSGGPGPLNYGNYQLHSGDATDSSIINGDQQVFTFNHFNTALKLYRYSSSDSIWSQIGSIDGVRGQPIADKTVSLSNDGSIVALSSYNTSSTYTARYFFIQIETMTSMHFAEIQIYDENGTNIAWNKPAVQSSAHTTASNAVNDDTTDFHHTSSSSTERQWLGVNLGENKEIASIKVYGRAHTNYISGGPYYSRTAPFRIFLYEDGEYPESSFTDGGTGPLNYNDYQLHSGDATDSSTINGDQQVFTFNTFPIGNVRVFQYDNSNNTWPQLGQTIQNEIRHNGGITTSLTNYNDSTTVAVSSYDTSSTYTARYFFLQLESRTEQFLNLAEIKIFDENNNNLAYAVRDVAGSTIQTNTHHPTNDVARSAVDGVLTNYQSTTTGAVRPWWGIDLGENKEIASIKIYGRSGSSYVLTFSRIGPFRIFLYEDGEYPESSFKYGTDGGTGPLNYYNYQLHTDDATDATYINSQSIFTFNTFHPIRGNARVFQYSNTTTTWTQLGQTIEGKVDNATNVSLSNDGNTVSIGSSVVPFTARYLFIQLENENQYFGLNELEIYDETGINIALNKPSALSELHNITYNPSSKANDGISSVSSNLVWTKETAGKKGWWAVDLGTDQTIASIKTFGAIGATYIPGGGRELRISPYRIFLYTGAEYTGTFANGYEGGTGPLDYDNYYLHTDDATTNETINGNQQVFTFNIAEYHHKTGNARVFTYDTTATNWTQLGGDIDGEETDCPNNTSVLSGDGTIIAIGAPYNDGVNGTDSGHVRVYQRDSNKTIAVTDQTSASFGPVGWTRLGQDIDGYAAGDESGSSLSLSNDGFTVAIGAPKNDGTGTDSGHTRVYKYASATNGWTQIGQDIGGNSSGDQFGSSVALSGDGTIIVSGAPYNDINGSNSGIIRVYQYGSVFGTLNIGGIMVGHGSGGITNTLLGRNALQNNHNGTGNTAIGYQALTSNTTGVNNVANGYQSLSNNTTGVNNVANGYQSLMSNTTGYANSANGYQALTSNTTGFNNVANGYQSLMSNTTGYQNSAFGYKALYNNTTADNNTAIGLSALEYNTSHSNVAVGYKASVNSTGTAAYRNTAIGGLAIANTTGRNTVGVGYNAGLNNTTGNHNTFLGAYTDINPTNATWTRSTAIGIDSEITASSQLVLGDSSTTVHVPYRIGIGTTDTRQAPLCVNGYIDYVDPNTSNHDVNLFVQNIPGGGAEGFSAYYGFAKNNEQNWNDNGFDFSFWVSHDIKGRRLIMMSSSAWSDERLKTNIEDVPDNLALQQVRDIPCKYYNYIDVVTNGHYKTIGFIAQEVNEVFPMAITKTPTFIPDEYRLLENVSWEEILDPSNNITYTMSCDSMTDLSGEKYQFICKNDLSDNRQPATKEIIKNSDNTFTFDVSYQYVFCYGKEVKDGFTVDKDKIFALHHSAIQEIDRLQLEEKEKTTALETKVTELETKTTVLETKVTELETKTTVLETKTTELETKNTTLETKNTELETKNAELQTQLDNIMTILNNNNLS